MKIYGIGYPYDTIIYADSKEEAIKKYTNKGHKQFKQSHEELFLLLEEVSNVDDFIFRKRLESSPSLRKRYELYLKDKAKAFLLFDDKRGFFNDYQVIE